MNSSEPIELNELYTSYEFSKLLMLNKIKLDNQSIKKGHIARECQPKGRIMAIDLIKSIIKVSNQILKNVNDDEKEIVLETKYQTLKGKVVKFTCCIVLK